MLTQRNIRGNTRYLNRPELRRIIPTQAYGCMNHYKPTRHTTIKNTLGFMIIFFSLFIILSPILGDIENNPRFLPTPYILELSSATIPLSLEMAVTASLQFSGVPDDNLEQRKNQIYTIIDKVKEQVTDLTSGKDKAEKVLHYLHEHIFRHYVVNQTRIDVVFDKGTFNCVSSAVLYLLCIKAIGLSVWGIKTKDHAFCRVETEEGDFDIETTNIYGFNPGEKKEFTDKFGNLTGYSYVPPGKYSKRTEVNDLELLSLIIQNRITYFNERDMYYDAFELAIDLYNLLLNEDTFNTLIAITGNMALLYTKKQEHEKGILFYDTMLTMFPENALLLDVSYKLIHNYIIYLLNKKMIDDAEHLVILRDKKGLFKTEDFNELMIYIVLDKANLLSKESFIEAVDIIKQAIIEYGEDKRLIKIKNSLLTNWIASYLNKKEWDWAEELINSLLFQSEISQDQWNKSMSIICNGRAVIIAEEQGNLEAAEYLKQYLEILKNDKVLKNNYSYYLYNYTAEIHNKVVKLVKEKKLTEALALLQEGLENVADSTLLKEDLEKVGKMIDS